MIDFNGLLFDLDGTVLDTAPDFVTTINTLLKRYDRVQLDSEAVRNRVSDGSIGLLELAFNISPTDSNFETLQSELLTIYFEHAGKKTKMFPNINEILTECDLRTIPWGIVTNKHWLYTEILLTRLNLIDRAHCVICSDHVKEPKPHPESLELGIKHLGLRADDCIYIGDHSRDILAAKNAKMRSIVAAWGYINKDEKISYWDANWITLTPEKLFDLLFKELEY
tara:strand:+ start:44413 stop:45084 length:672 start_codon:yes stop_codon:yes gene_type:complete